MTYFGEVGLYLGIAGIAVSIIHGALKLIRDPRRLRMVIIAGMVVSGAAFLSFSAFHFKPEWFGLAHAPITTKENNGPSDKLGSHNSPPNVMGPVTGNKGIVTQDQKGDNRQ